MSNVSLNDSKRDVCRVNVVRYSYNNKETGKTGKCMWVTDVPVTDRQTVKSIAKGGRARWHIENETFNTLKNR